MSTAPQTVIESIRVDGFGRFHDFELALGSRLNVLTGPNEAGKSTLWSFISAMLFGFERRSEPTRYEPVGGSAFGGELRLKTMGGRVIVRRQGHKRRVEGEVTLRDGAGVPLPEARLDEARGQVSRELFTQVFSLTIDQLRTFGDLAGSEISARLFAAAMQGAQRLPSALDTLSKECGDLFLPKGQRPINTWLRELSGVRLRLEGLGDRPAAYAHDQAQKEQLEALLGSLELEVNAATTRVRDVERLQKSLAPFEALRRAEAAQAGRDDLAHFPLEARGRFESVVKSLRDVTETIAESEHEVFGLESSLARIAQALKGKNQPDAVRAALRQWDTVIVQARELPAALAQLDVRQQQLGEALKRTPVPEADLQWLENVDVSVALQTELKALRDRHVQAREECARVLAALTSARDEHSRRTEKSLQLAHAVAAIEEHDVDDLRRQLAALGQVASLVQQHTHLSVQRASSAAQVQGLEVPVSSAPRARFPLWLAGGAAVALVFLAVATWAAGAAGLSAVWFALVLSLVGLVAAWRDEASTSGDLLVWHRARRYQSEQRLSHQAAVVHLDGQLTQVAQRLSAALRLGDTVDASEVALRTAAVQSLLDAQDRRRGLANQQREANDETSRVEQAVQAFEDERARAEALLDVIQSEVDERLAPLGIRASLSAEAALDVVADVHRLQERAATLKADRAGLLADAQRVAQATAMLEQQGREVGVIAYSAASTESSFKSSEVERGLRAQPSSSTPPTALASMLHDWLEADARARAEEATLCTRRDAAMGPLDKHRLAVAQLTAELNEMLELASVTSVEAFRQRAAEAQTWADAEVERRQACATMAAFGGTLDEMRRQALDGAALADDALRAASALDEVSKRREVTLEALGRLRARLEQYEVQAEAALLRREEEGLVVRIRQAAERYAVSALARTVLEHARERFDAEQQPRVVQRAAALFSELTDHRYVQVRPDPRARQLWVRDAQGVNWQVEQLSRGTRELLLLAFRLAVVEDFGEVRIALPVMLDDITVNFDADRAARVIDVLARLSSRHQILAFTCHAPVQTLFREAGAQVHEVVQRTQLLLLG